jgi:hypothetical protein
MNQTQWDEKLRSFLKKTGEDFKRAGNDIKTEAEKLLKEVKDPDRQAKLKAGVKDFGGWARKTAEEMAELMETGVKKAESALTRATDKVVDFTVGQKEAAEKMAKEPAASGAHGQANGHRQAKAEAEAPAEAEHAPGKRPKKSIGGSKRKSQPRKSAAKKSIGKTPKPDDE